MGKRAKVRILSGSLQSPALIEELRKLKKSFKYVDWLDESMVDLREQLVILGKEIYDLAEVYRYAWIDNINSIK